VNGALALGTAIETPSVVYEKNGSDCTMLPALGASWFEAGREHALSEFAELSHHVE
jgi:hypothetical protein